MIRDFDFRIKSVGEAFRWAVAFRKEKDGELFKHGGGAASPFRCFAQMIDYMWSVFNA